MDIIIYRANDIDSFSALWLAGHKVFTEARCVAVKDGDEPDIRPTPDRMEDGLDVLLLGVTYPRDVLARMRTQAKSLTIISRDREALEALSDSCECDNGIITWNPARPKCMLCHGTGRKLHSGVVWDPTKSVGRLTWEWIASNNLWPMDSMEKHLGIAGPPWPVTYVEDRSHWQLPHSREINAVLESFPMTFEQWDSLADYRLNSGDPAKVHPLVEQGSGIIRYRQRLIDRHIAEAREVELGGEKCEYCRGTGHPAWDSREVCPTCHGKKTVGGHSVLAVNATVLQSEIADELAKIKMQCRCCNGKGVADAPSTPTEGDCGSGVCPDCRGECEVTRSFGAVFHFTTDGNRVWTLRSAVGFDVGEMERRLNETDK